MPPYYERTGHSSSADFISLVQQHAGTTQSGFDWTVQTKTPDTMQLSAAPHQHYPCC
ncbi:MAG: hypothetical protein AAF404_05775 [Pseudomonadota bacterium]